ncbi:MAG: ATP-binding cassette domain-containing protein [Bacteroidota bacterium]
MHIKLSDIGKRYNRDWIFRHLDYNFESGKAYAILGSNGSGKSTLLKTIAGFISPTEGNIEYENTAVLAQEEVFKEVAFAAPYLEIYEEFTLPEALRFHEKLKPLSIEASALMDVIRLPLYKRIETFSSGMKQKVKLALAIYSETSMLFLDEPTINLDAKSKSWYEEQIQNVKANKLIVVSSNYEKVEYSFAAELIQIENFKAS